MNYFLAALGLGCLAFGFLTNDAPVILFGFLNFLLALGSMELRDWKRNRSASADLSALGREHERISWRDAA